MAERTCSIDGCDNKSRSWGWCKKHYTRWLVHGDPLFVLPAARVGNPTHGHAPDTGSSPTYLSWKSMKQRCLNPNATAYDRYGGAGITIHQPWVDSFEAFLADMGERPEGMTLDRAVLKRVAEYATRDGVLYVRVFPANTVAGPEED